MPRKAKPWFRESTGGWYVTHQGIPQTPLGVFGKENEQLAWAAFQKLLENAVQSKPSVRPEPLSALASDFLASFESRALPKTIKDYGYNLREFLARFGNSASADIVPQTVELHCSKQGWSDSHRNNVLWTVQAFIRWTGRADFTMRRPAKESRGADAIITEETQRQVLREASGDFHELCRLLWHVGCRPMEGARLTADRVDWTAGTVTIKGQQKGKRKGKQRILYLSTEALVILKEQSNRYGNQGPLFRGIHGQQLTQRAVVGRMLRIQKKIGKPVTSYAYRHSWATRALVAGVPDTHVAAMLGHSSTAMLWKHYAHLGQNAQTLREAANKVG